MRKLPLYLGLLIAFGLPGAVAAQDGETPPVHCRSEVGEAGTVSKLPAAQLETSTHTRSDVAVGARASNCGAVLGAMGQVGSPFRNGMQRRPKLPPPAGS